jgi:serine O-acetyltransferase
VIGPVTIADDVAVGANAVVIRDITEPGTTWAGIPARKVSDMDSHRNLCADLFPQF